MRVVSLSVGSVMARSLACRMRWPRSTEPRRREGKALAASSVRLAE